VLLIMETSQKNKRYKKVIIITLSVLVLQLLFGFDPKFCIINIIWLFV